MPIYRKYNTYYVQITKNASTSIHSKLNDDNSERRYHSTYIEELKMFDYTLAELTKCTSFAIVRNPYDRLISAYEYMQDVNPTPQEDFETFVKRLQYENINELDVVYKQQHEFIVVDDKIVVDNVYHYENFNWETIANKINENSINKIDYDLEHYNKTENKINNYKTYYTPELQKLVYKIYEKDFKYFNYSFDL